MHICVYNLTIIGSDNGRIARILLIEASEINFSEISIEILAFFFKKMPLEM